MTNRHLEYFLKVYEERSIKKAADALFITPQGVSRTILELEHELEMMLFIRDGTSMIRLIRPIFYMNMPKES